MIKACEKSILWIRAFAVLCIVLHHSIGLWSISGKESFDVYGTSLDGVSPVLKYVGLVSFFFISGYLFDRTNVNEESFGSVLKRKYRRLGIPCVFWGAFYFCVYYHYCSQSISFTMGASNYVLPLPILGSHLWFIPVLFLCTIVTYLIKRSRLKEWIAFPIIAAIYLCNLRPIYSSVYLWYFTLYCPVFILGSMAHHYKGVIQLGGVKILLIMLWISALIMKYILNKNMYGLVNTGCLLPVLLIMLCNNKSESDSYFCPKIVKTIADKSFGIYLIHQFVINFLVIQLNVSKILRGDILVLVLFSCSIIFSYILTDLISKSRMKPILGL